MVKFLRLVGLFRKFFLLAKKIQWIPPIFENNLYITDFKEKAELFNSFFGNQCFLIIDNIYLPPTLSCKTNEGLSLVKITDYDNLK